MLLGLLLLITAPSLASLITSNQHTHSYTHKVKVAHVLLPDATLWVKSRQWNVPFIWGFYLVNAHVCEHIVCWVHMLISNGGRSLPRGCLWCSWPAAAPGNTLSPPLCWLSRLPPPPPSGPSTGHSPCRQHTERQSYSLVWLGPFKATIVHCYTGC